MAGIKQTVTFTGTELKKLSVKKTASLDKEYSLVMVTADPAIMNLDAYAPDVTFTVAVEVES